MSVSMVRRLIAKDLYLLRPLMVGALVFGGIGVALMPLGEIQFFVGWILLFIAVVLLGVLATAVGVTTERKDKVHLFVLTLPISPTQYTAAKLAASAIAFFVPWVLLSAAAFAVIAVTPAADSLMAFIAALMLYAFCYYSAYLAVSLVTDSVIWSTLVIIVGNTAPVFLIPGVARLLDIGAEQAAAGPIWTPAVVSILALEVVFGVAVLALAVLIRSRQRDFA